MRLRSRWKSRLAIEPSKRFTHLRTILLDKTEYGMRNKAITLVR